MDMSTLTVKDVKDALKGLPDSMQVTFGSSRHSKRPLIFYRFKSRADLLHIELNELNDEQCTEDSELECRITVGDIREEFRKFWKDTDKVIFGDTVDGIPLFAESIEPALSFNLDQPIASE